MLIIDNVTYAHPGQSVPYCFDMRVSLGEIVAVTGVSGSGKSTLLDLIAGFLDPATGEIRLDDTDISALPPQTRPVSILFQKDNLFDHLSVAQNLALGLANKTDKTAFIAKALEQVELPGFENRRANTLSGGQQQRVALARTLLRDEPVLLLDEPFDGLDIETAANMRTLLRRLTIDKNWHVILVSHDPADAEFADRKLSLSNGLLRPE